VKDPGIKPFYDKLIGALAHDEALRDGDWRQAHVTPSQVLMNLERISISISIPQEMRCSLFSLVRCKRGVFMHSS
jgi:hypothetical protein